MFGNPFGGCDRACQLRVGKVTDSRSGHDGVPPDANSVIQADAHEAMVQLDRPTLRRRHARQRVPGQNKPPVEQGWS